MAKFKSEKEAIDFLVEFGLIDCSIKTREEALALAASLSDEYVNTLLYGDDGSSPTP